jgi:hypothetical protein
MLTEHRSGDERPRDAAAVCRPPEKATACGLIHPIIQLHGSPGRTADDTAGGTACRTALPALAAAKTGSTLAHSQLHSTDSYRG